MRVYRRHGPGRGIRFYSPLAIFQAVVLGLLVAVLVVLITLDVLLLVMAQRGFQRGRLVATL